MNIIIVGQRHGKSKTSLGPPARRMLLRWFSLLIAFPGAAGYFLTMMLADEGL